MKELVAVCCAAFMSGTMGLAQQAPVATLASYPVIPNEMATGTTLNLLARLTASNCPATPSGSVSFTESGSTVTATSSAALPTGFVAGSSVTVIGAGIGAGVTGYNISATILSVNFNTNAFTYFDSNSGLAPSSGGTATIGACLVVAGASDTSGDVGIVIAGAGTSGAATVQTAGFANCLADGTISAGHYLIPGSVTAGACKDSGSSPPSAPPMGSIGFAVGAGSTGGNYVPVLLFTQKQ
ncbi:MAG TPA: hypothetical protein VGW33_03860 [Terriglobia bacterium]|nr:hypothetical protein [Terriglobia bacterium]